MQLQCRGVSAVRRQSPPPPPLLTAARPAEVLPIGAVLSRRTLRVLVLLIKQRRQLGACNW